MRFSFAPPMAKFSWEVIFPLLAALFAITWRGSNGNGSVDSAFEGLSGATDFVPAIYALATQPDGKILVGGFFSSLNGASRYNFLRLNPDGTVDSTFGVAFGTNGTVRAILIQPDGKILIAGGFLCR